MAERKHPAGKAFSAEEQAAMKEAARERRAAKRGSTREDGEREVLEKIAGFPEPDRALASRVHELVTATAPGLEPRTWYGMPAYTLDGKVICHFRNAAKFRDRYSTLGFGDRAALDDGEMWPTSFALTGMTPDVEERIVELVRRAIG